jgi:hypothetical protein
MAQVLGTALGATTLITGAIAAARIGGGWLIDRYRLAFVMAGAQLWALMWCGPTQPVAYSPRAPFPDLP